jgi:hypothetical protein
VKVTDNALKIMLRRAEAELTLIELFAWDFYFEPRENMSGSGHHPSIWAPDNLALTWNMAPDYRRLLEAISKIRAVRESISDRL